MLYNTEGLVARAISNNSKTMQLVQEHVESMSRLPEDFLQADLQAELPPVPIADDELLSRELLIHPVALMNETQFNLEGGKVCGICCNFKYMTHVAYFCCNNHSYCKGCIIGILRTNLNSFQIIRCPEQNCNVELDTKSPYYENLKEADKIKLMKIRRNRQILSNPQIKLCRKQQCKGVLNFQSKKAQCAVCKIEHCLKCLDLSHKGRCDQSIAKALQRKHHLRHCPNCRMIVEKNQGCDHMTCYCSYEFCYRCGKQFQSSGHVCQFSKPQGFLNKIREQIQRRDEFPNRQLNSILTFLEPDYDSQLMRYIQLLLTMLLFYPAANVLTIGISLAIVALWLAFTIAVIVLYTVFKPLIEIKVMSLPLATYLLRTKDLPVWLVTLLLVPLYPVNVLLTIRTIPMLFQGDTIERAIEKLLLSTLSILLLPCLLLNQQDGQ